MKKPIKPKLQEIRHHTRKFLNKDEGIAAIETTITLERNDLSSSKDISDWNRKVSLDFYMYSPKAKVISQRINKLNILVDSLVAFRDNYLKVIELAKERDKVLQAYYKERTAWNKLNPNDKVQSVSLSELFDD